MIQILDSNPLTDPAKSPHKSCDKKQPFPDSGWLIDLPDLITADERQRIAEFQRAYKKAEAENLRYSPNQAHRYLDEIKKRLDDPNIATDEHAAALASIASGREGFRQMRKSTARQLSRASVAAIPLTVSILERHIPLIKERIELLDRDHSTHWQRCAGRSCNEPSPLAAGLRRLLQDVGERLDEDRRTLEQQRMHIERKTAEPYEHVQPITRLRGVVRWMPETSTEEAAQ